MYTPTPLDKIFFSCRPPTEPSAKKIPTYRERIGFTGGDQEPLPFGLGFFLLRLVAGSESLASPTAYSRHYAVPYCSCTR